MVDVRFETSKDTMNNKSPFKKLKNVVRNEKKLKNEIKDEIITILKEEGYIDYEITFLYGYLIICLPDNSISKELISRVNKYCDSEGDLSSSPYYPSIIKFKYCCDGDDADTAIIGDVE